MKDVTKFWKKSPGSRVLRAIPEDINPAKKYIRPLVEPDKYKLNDVVKEDEEAMVTDTDPVVRDAQKEYERKAAKRKGRRSTLMESPLGAQKSGLG